MEKGPLKSFMAALFASVETGTGLVVGSFAIRQLSRPDPSFMLVSPDMQETMMTIWRGKLNSLPAMQPYFGIASMGLVAIDALKNDVQPNTWLGLLIQLGINASVGMYPQSLFILSNNLYNPEQIVDPVNLALAAIALVGLSRTAIALTRQVIAPTIHMFERRHRHNLANRERQAARAARVRAINDETRKVIAEFGLDYQEYDNAKRIECAIAEEMRSARGQTPGRIPDRPEIQSKPVAPVLHVVIPEFLAKSIRTRDRQQRLNFFDKATR